MKHYNFRKGEGAARTLRRYGVSMDMFNVNTFWSIPKKYEQVTGNRINWDANWRKEATDPASKRKFTMELRKRVSSTSTYILFTLKVDYDNIICPYTQRKIVIHDVIKDFAPDLAVLEVVHWREVAINLAAQQITHIRDRVANSIRGIYYTEKARAACKPEPTLEGVLTGQAPATAVPAAAPQTAVPNPKY
jgi:hypothetical protein